MSDLGRLTPARRLYPISVRRTHRLPVAFFRSRIAPGTLAFQPALPLTGWAGGLAPPKSPLRHHSGPAGASRRRTPYLAHQKNRRDPRSRRQASQRARFWGSMARWVRRVAPSGMINKKLLAALCGSRDSAVMGSDSGYRAPARRCSRSSFVTLPLQPPCRRAECSLQGDAPLPKKETMAVLFRGFRFFRTPSRRKSCGCRRNDL